MTDKDRIAELERLVKAMRADIADLQARPYVTLDQIPLSLWDVRTGEVG